jgi:hypothetical protein
MVRVGEDISEKLDIVPAEFFVHRHIRAASSLSGLLGLNSRSFEVLKCSRSRSAAASSKPMYDLQSTSRSLCFRNVGRIIKCDPWLLRLESVSARGRHRRC